MKANHLVLAIVITLTPLHVTVCTMEEAPTCDFIDILDDNDLLGNEEGSYHSTTQCSNTSICKKTFNITYIVTPPYFIKNDSKQEHGIYPMLRKCCGPCTMWKETILENITQLTHNHIKNSHIVYPLLASNSETRLYGAYYLPYMSAPGFYFITRLNDSFFIDILSMYPIIIVCLLLAVIAGFVAWILETWGNEDEFPRPFHLGLFEGFWWSFISMTTVGYGDKTIKSVPARLFAVVWIITGIVGFGILTGQLTGEIVKANSPPPESIHGKKVGVLRFREYDTFMITHIGGHIVHNDDVHNFETDVIGLVDKLQKDEINGIILDRHTMYSVAELAPSLFTETQLKFFIERTLRTEKEFDIDVSYGMLLNHKEDYEYFKDYSSDARLRLKMFYSKRWVEVKKKQRGRYYSIEGENRLFSVEANYFKHTLVVILVLAVFLLIFGCFYECWRRNLSLFPKRSRSVGPQADDLEKQGKNSGYT